MEENESNSTLDASDKDVLVEVGEDFSGASAIAPMDDLVDC